MNLTYNERTADVYVTFIEILYFLPAVGIATRYGLDGRRIVSLCVCVGVGGDFPHPSRPAHPASCAMGTGSLSLEQSGRSVVFNTHPHLAPRLKKE